MKFWDSSAIIPLCLNEAYSEKIVRLIKSNEDIIVWWATRIECQSALARRRREGALAVEAELAAKTVLSRLSEAWSEVLPRRTGATKGGKTAIRPSPSGSQTPYNSQRLWSGGKRCPRASGWSVWIKICGKQPIKRGLRSFRVCLDSNWKSETHSNDRISKYETLQHVSFRKLFFTAEAQRAQSLFFSKIGRYRFLKTYRPAAPMELPIR